MAKRLCPQLVITKADFQKYNFYSEAVMRLLAMYDLDIEVYGVDEACIKFDEKKLRHAYNVWKNGGEAGRMIQDEDCVISYEASSFFKYKDSEEIKNSNKTIFSFDGKLTFDNVSWIVDKIRKVIHRNTQLTISAGISVCRGLAKYASDINKPNGQYNIEKDFDDFLKNLKVDDINGIGKKRKIMLEQTLGIKTIGDLREKCHLLYFMFREKTFMTFFRFSYGLICFDRSIFVDKRNSRKSIGRDVTFPVINSYSFFCDVLWDASCELEQRLSKANTAGFVVTLRIRYHDFTSFTRQSKCDKPVHKCTKIFDAAYKIFCDVFEIKPTNKTISGLNKIKGLSMLGVKVSELITRNKLETIHGFKSNLDKNVTRICPICNYTFYIEPQISVERHVDNCITKKLKKERHKKKSILYFCKKSK
ncbi:hypothetical protein BDAP_000355 [Binucleata daphniae]